VHFGACPSKNVIKHGASGKKGMCAKCKSLFSELDAMWSMSRLKTYKNIQKTCFWQKALGWKHVVIMHNKQDMVSERNYDHT